MNPGGGAGDLSITVGGDLTPLQAAFDQIPVIAEAAFGELETAIQAIDWSDVTQGVNSVSDSLAGLNEAVAGVVPEVEALGEQLDLFAEVPLSVMPEVNQQFQLFATYTGEAAAAVEDLGAATASMTPSIGNLATATADADENTASFIGRLGLAYLAFNTVKAGITELVTAYGDLQSAQLSLGALLGDNAAANAAIDQAKQLADALGLDQAAAISAQQKLVALGQSISQVPADLTAIADGAAAMNTSFDTAAQRFDQIINSGALMQRSLTSIGLSVNDVASAMGMAGVPATLLTTAFKGLDEEQRAAVLSSAELTKNMGLAATAASGVAGTWNDVKNAIVTAFQEMGQQVNGFTALATLVVDAVHLIEQAFTGMSATVKIAVDAAITVFQSVLPAVEGFAQVFEDALTGNFKDIPADIKSTEGAIQDALTSGMQAIQGDVTQAGNSVATIWGGSMQSVANSTTTAVATSGAALNVLQSAAQKAASNFAAVSAAFEAGKVSAADYTATLAALNKAQEDANGGLEQFGTAVLIAANNFRTQTVDLMNAKTTLDAVAVAAAAGASNWTAYDAALKQLNTDQMAFNNGQQDAHTALLMVQEDFQNMGVAEENAQTNLDAVTQAMANGQAGLTQYTAALQTAYKAQLDLNNGVATIALQLQMAENSWQNASAAATNAANKAIAYYQALQAGYPVLQQTIDAVNGAGAAMEKAAGGVVTWQSALLSLSGQESQLELNLSNANQMLATARQQLADGAIGIGLYTKVLQAQQAAQDAVTGSSAKATAQTQAQTTAQNGLTNAFAAAKNAANGFADANTTVSDGMTASQVRANNYATSLQYLNGQWVNLGTAAITANDAVNTAATGMQVINGQFVNLGTSAQTATNTGLAPFATQLQFINGQFVNMASSGANAAAGISAVGKAAATATGQVEALGQQLDKIMGDVPGKSLGASLDANDLMSALNGATLNETLKPGDTYSQPTGGNIVAGSFGSQNPSTYIQSSEVPFGNETMTYDPAGVTQAATAVAAAANSLAASTTSVTASTAAMAAALQQVTDANVLEQQAAAAYGTTAYASLKSVADAAATAAAASLASAEATTANTTAVTASTDAITAQMDATTSLTTSVAGLSNAALNSGNALVAINSTMTTAAAAISTVSTASSNLTGVLNDSAQTTENALNSLTVASQAAAAAALANAKTPVIGPPSGTLLYGVQTGVPGSGVGGVPNTFAPSIGNGIGTGSGIGGGVGNGSQPVTINIQSNGTVVGANGMQQFANIIGSQIVQSLAQRGIRLNRQ